ncbi:Cthe_2314 family HEPN domain-containing protein [Photobacterium leiognathi]|uniref:Cthe_2314 family HEPN domain-containing protein n=1 Tax=Photobacterium leiognathi TaxID=553611 RepID=UPI0029811852|nr:Cthe_2314 family HEPN domain-containing protein [Photobacterium leiognathi]
MLKAQQNGHVSVEVSEKQKYAHDIYARVMEIDNAFKALNLSLEYLEKDKFDNSEFELSDHYAFHAENFLLRLTSVVDRCHLFAGTSVLLDKSLMERIGGNRYVYDHMLKNFPQTAAVLQKLNKSVSKLRTRRNKVAHQEGVSSQNLVVIQAMENDEENFLSEVSQIMDPEKIRTLVREEISSDFKPVVVEMKNLVSELIDSLAPIYQELTKDT